MLMCVKGECWSHINFSLLHLEAIRVSVESLVVVEVSDVELRHDFVAIVDLLERQAFELDVDADEAEVWVQ